MSVMASQADVSIVCTTVCSGADKENIKVMAFLGETTGDRWILRTKGQ